MNDPQETAIERVESEPPESADSDLSDEALDRPAGGERPYYHCSILPRPRPGIWAVE